MRESRDATAILCFMFCTLCSGQESSDKYAFVIKEIRTGTSIPVPVIRSRIPFDKNYEALSIEQKQLLMMRAGSGLTEPPFPKNGLETLVKPIYKAAEKAGVNGEFSADVLVSADGTPQSISIRKSPDSRVTLVAEVALLNEIYKAGRCDDSYCDGSFTLDIQLMPEN